MTKGSFAVADIAHENSHAGFLRPKYFDSPAIASFVQRYRFDDASAVSQVPTTNLNALALKNNALPSGVTTGTGVHFVGVRGVHRTNS
jgi:hypothetical protein